MSTSTTVPSYRLHNPSGSAIVTLAGRTVYLGKFGTRESREACRRAIAEYMTTGRPPATRQAAPVSQLTLVQLSVEYLRCSNKNSAAKARN